MASTTTPPTNRATPDDPGGAPGAARPAIARHPDDAEAPDAPRLLLFRAAGRLLGCPLADAREVLVGGGTTRLPGAPAHVVGLRNVRGRLLTVLDVARALGHAQRTPGAGLVLVVDAGDGRLAGCRVDAVLRVAPVPPLDPVPAGDAVGDAIGNAAARAIVLGVGEVEGERLTVLDLPRCVRATLVDPGER